MENRQKKWQNIMTTETVKQTFFKKNSQKQNKFDVNPYMEGCQEYDTSPFLFFYYLLISDSDLF